MASNKRREAPTGPVACPNCGVKHRTKTFERCVDEGMSERTLQDRVVDRAKRRGWKVAHAGRGWVGNTETGEGQFVTPMAPGWPDLFLLHARQAPYRLAMELKKENGEVSEEQQEYLDLMNACGIPAVVVRPSDLRLGRVNAILKGR